jgi:hypothetical protein
MCGASVTSRQQINDRLFPAAIASPPMPHRLGPVIAERTLQIPGSKRPALARLGTPRPSRRASWECPYQVTGIRDSRVRVVYGEDALQTIILACVALRNALSKRHASWLGLGDSGIPAVIPYIAPEITAHLEAVVHSEMNKVTKKLKHAVGRTGKRPRFIVVSGRRIELR